MERVVTGCEEMFRMDKALSELKEWMRYEPHQHCKCVEDAGDGTVLAREVMRALKRADGSTDAVNVMTM